MDGRALRFSNLNLRSSEHGLGSFRVLTPEPTPQPHNFPEKTAEKRNGKERPNRLIIILEDYRK
jgi:hypothetical protein